MPKGIMPATQGNPDRLHEDKWMLGASANLNVESEAKVPTTPAPDWSLPC